MANVLLSDCITPIPNRLLNLEGVVENNALADEGDHCFVICKKLGPNVFFIKSGLAIIDEKKNLLSAQALSVTCPTKIIFDPS